MRAGGSCAVLLTAPPAHRRCQSTRRHLPLFLSPSSKRRQRGACSQPTPRRCSAVASGCREELLPPLRQRVLRGVALTDAVSGSGRHQATLLGLAAGGEPRQSMDVGLSWHGWAAAALRTLPLLPLQRLILLVLHRHRPCRHRQFLRSRSLALTTQAGKLWICHTTGAARICQIVDKTSTPLR